jgi:hypothetical protein
VPPGKWCLPTYSIRPTCDPNFGRKILHPNMVWTCMALSPVLFDESGVQVACATNTAVIPIYDYGSFRFVDNAVGIVDPFEKLSDGITFRYRCHQDTIDRLNDSTTSKNYIVSRINHFVIGEDPCTKTLKNKLSGLGFRNVAGGSSSIGSSHGECDCLDSDVTGVSNRFYHDYKSPCWSCYERINNAGETYSLPYPCISANSINRIHDETDEPVKTLCGETKYYEFDSMCEDIEIRITRAAVKRPPKIVTTVT